MQSPPPRSFFQLVTLQPAAAPLQVANVKRHKALFRAPRRGSRLLPPGQSARPAVFLGLATVWLSRRPCRSSLRRSAEQSDDALFSGLQERVKELQVKERERASVIESIWKNGPTKGGIVASVDDWVRRVACLGSDLFVGTSTSGVQRYILGDNEPKQRLRVHGDPTVPVPADHPAVQDPATSVTSLQWDGCWLAAGLAGGYVHLWDSDGADVFQADFPGPPRPCYVALADKALVAASGSILKRWKLAIGETPGKPEATAELSSRIHCLVHHKDGQVVVGLEDGYVEVRGEDLRLLLRQPAHTDPVSAVCMLNERAITGDSTGELVCWDTTGVQWEQKWLADEHKGRVVEIKEGGAGTIVSGALDGTIRTWWANSGDLHFSLAGHKVWLGSICIPEDKSRMVTDGRDNSVFLLDFAAKGDEEV